jgi:c-di-GMP-binding flagellar brake protein YcgR
MLAEQMSEQEGIVAAVVERRRRPRLKVAIPMFVRGTDQHGKPFVDFATVLNISAGGALLVLKRRLQTEAQASLEIPVGLIPQILLTKLVQQIQVRTVRVEPAENSFVVGVQFVNPLTA